MSKPVLVIMAAGMGSRYGGLKQIDPVDDQGQIIMDFSIYDAKKAGFEEVVFIIKKEFEAEFRAAIGRRIEKVMKVKYVYQSLDTLPEGFSVPLGRQKPWGTGHALLCCKDVVKGAFAAINADDFYGRDAFVKMYDYLTTHKDDEIHRFAMVGYYLKNTITEHGYVSRGVCSSDKDNFLTEVVERIHIEKSGEAIFYEEPDKTRVTLEPDTLVSMNFWGFSNAIMEILTDGFKDFLEQQLKVNPLKGEYFIPAAVEDGLESGKCTVEVLTSDDKWYGVTYKEDKDEVVAGIQSLKAAGRYPDRLWK